MYEHRHDPLLPVRLFWRRMARNVFLSALVLAAALGIGMTGYSSLEDMRLCDAFLNASMILSGMGPVSELHTEAGKLFAGVYALFCGLIFTALLGFVFAPVFHRFLHKFHRAHSQDRDDT